MSILIKGMTMPKNCYECPLMMSVFVFKCDSNMCSITKGGCIINGRPPHCPLIEVPPHGRLIDADALIRQMSQKVEETNNARYAWVDSIDISLADTIIEAEPDCTTCPVKGKACKVFYRDKGDDSVCKELREAEGEDG